MDDLDAKLQHERARLVGLLGGLADALNRLSMERLAEVLPMAASLDDIGGAYAN